VVLFGSYGGNVLNFLLFRRKTVALMSINCVAGQTFCDKWFICDATLFVGKMLQGEFKRRSNQKVAINMDEKSWNLLPRCQKEAENLDIIFACDGAASVGQVANYVAIDLTNRNIGARMCCTAAIGAGSETHINIAKRAKRVIVINGCASRCVSKIFEKLGIKVDFEFVIQDLGVKKIPTLDIDDEETKRIADEIADKVGYWNNGD
jgi:uncharacterized metal-binding protein